MATVKFRNQLTGPAYLQMLVGPVGSPLASRGLKNDVLQVGQQEAYSLDDGDDMYYAYSNLALPSIADDKYCLAKPGQSVLLNGIQVCYIYQ